MAHQSKRGEELNKTNHQTLSKPFPNTQKIPCMLLLLLLEFKSDFVEFQVVHLYHFKSSKRNKKEESYEVWK